MPFDLVFSVTGPAALTLNQNHLTHSVTLALLTLMFPAHHLAHPLLLATLSASMNSGGTLLPIDTRLFISVGLSTIRL